MGSRHQVLEGALRDSASDRVWEKPLGIKDILTCVGLSRLYVKLLFYYYYFNAFWSKMQEKDNLIFFFLAE